MSPINHPTLHWKTPCDNNQLDWITRLKQPFKFRLAIEYRHTYVDPVSNQTRKTGFMVKIFDGQWRNEGPIRERGPYTYGMQVITMEVF